MAKIANVATFPGRKAICADAVRSIASQVEQVNVVLNEYAFVPSELRGIRNAHFIFPPRDLKDVGKFYPTIAADDDVFLIDDDILYPPDYVARMTYFMEALGDCNAVIGLHGVTYSDYYEGRHGAGRLVRVFYKPLDRPQPVNQLGTGTVYCKGYQMPGFEFMQGAEQFVDIRFARHTRLSGYPNICVPRDENWLRQLNTDGSIFDSFTTAKPLHVVREVQEIAGFKHIDPAIWSKLQARLPVG